MSGRETAAILQLFRNGPEPFALATLVEVQGSSYRRAGARMLLASDGNSAGSISGGCLEEDVRQRARSVLATGVAEAFAYNTLDENDLIWGVGLGCHGMVRVFVERLLKMPDWAATLESNLDSFQPTFLRVPWDQADPQERGTHLADSMTPSLLPGVFSQVIEPPITLVICGAGDDAIPLAQLAVRMGWAVVVTDPRPAYATQQRFPEARKCLVAPPDRIAREIPVGDRTAVVIMTHHYRFDVPLLRGLVSKPLGYLGLLGPMKRAERILAEIETDGMAVTPEMRARLRAPVGLDLGSEAPEGIALSIVAEIHAVLTGRDGRPLKERASPIHA